MTGKKVNVAIIGLGFGAEFIPIYQKHAQANMYGICRRDEAEMNKIGDAFGIDKRFTSYDDVLSDPAVDFVHINSPIPDHAGMSSRGSARRACITSAKNFWASTTRLPQVSAWASSTKPPPGASMASDHSFKRQILSRGTPS